MRAYGWRYALRIVEKREDVRIRKQLAESLHNLFAATHVQQPIMDDRDAQCGQFLPWTNVGSMPCLGVTEETQHCIKSTSGAKTPAASRFRRLTSWRMLA